MRVSGGEVVNAVGEVAVAGVTFASDITDAELDAYMDRVASALQLCSSWSIVA